MEAAARALSQALRETGCLLVINDHVAVAVSVGADGVHLGQDDASPEWARECLGPGPLIGLSTHSIAQVEASGHDPAVDYIGFGPVFGTRTKDTGWSPRGLEILREANSRSRHPVIAIGGIAIETLPQVKATGVHGWAVVSALVGSDDLQGAVRAFS